MEIQNTISTSGEESLIVRNDDGKTIRSTGSSGWSTERFYRLDGQESHGNAYKDGVLDGEWKFEYDSQGRDIGYSSRKVRGEERKRGYTNAYSEDGTVKTHQSTDTLYGYISTTDKDGNEIYLMFLEGEDQLIGSGYESTYNENGDLLQKFRFDKGVRGALVSECFYDESGNLTRQEVQGAVVSNTEYNEHDDIIREDYGDGDGTLPPYEKKYTYDDLGRKSKTVDSNGTTVVWIYTKLSIVENTYHNGDLKHVSTTYTLEPCVE